MCGTRTNASNANGCWTWTLVSTTIRITIMINKHFLSFIFLCLMAVITVAQPIGDGRRTVHPDDDAFDQYFEDRTLRLDYIFAGDAGQQEIYVDELIVMPHWYGKRSRLGEVPLLGNGQLIVRSHSGDSVIYRHSFSTLFQEWLATDEAKRTKRSFENVFLMPMPKDTVNVTVELYDYHQKTIARMSHTVNPHDILIRQAGTQPTAYRTLQAAEHYDKCVKIAFVAEGYTESQMDDYLAHCQQAVDALFSHEPFKSLRPRFNIIALMTASADSGVSEPGNGIWRQTALGTHFDTFYSQRYLTTLHLKRLHDLLAGTPYEHIIILANTEHYGGGGIYNSYNLSYTRGKNFRPVVVHEFGHSFGGLGDEYPYGDSDPMYFADTEPWEPNLTTLLDFDSKWKHLMETDPRVGLVEGGGYLSKGVYRACENCRMRTNEEPEFCPVCQDALRRLINFYTE